MEAGTYLGAVRRRLCSQYFNCCDCGGDRIKPGCGCEYCFTCHACETCYNDRRDGTGFDPPPHCEYDFS